MKEYKRHHRGHRGKMPAQVTIEFTVAAIVMMLFLYCTIKIFCWAGQGLVNRHQYFEATRLEVTDYADGVDENYAGVGYVWEPDQVQALDIFAND